MSTLLTTTCGHHQHPNCPKHALDGDVSPCDKVIWTRICKNYSKTNVFLNVSYVKSYRSRLHTLVSLLENLGLNPMLANMEKREGASRLCKLCELIQHCKFCITDLSIAERHNMPFEAGMIFALGRRNIVLYGGPKLIGHTKLKVLDDRISNIKELDEIVYYDKNNIDTLAKNLLLRITNSPELLSLCPAPMKKHDDSGYGKWINVLTEQIIKNKKIIDDLYIRHNQNYVMALDELRMIRRSAPFQQTPSP